MWLILGHVGPPWVPPAAESMSCGTLLSQTKTQHLRILTNNRPSSWHASECMLSGLAATRTRKIYPDESNMYTQIGFKNCLNCFKQVCFRQCIPSCRHVDFHHAVLCQLVISCHLMLVHISAVLRASIDCKDWKLVRGHHFKNQAKALTLIDYPWDSESNHCSGSSSLDWPLAPQTGYKLLLESVCS